MKTKDQYNPQEIEKKWRAKWEKSGIYKPNLDSAKKPFYNLMMFPYPSAEGLHVGNMYAFTGSDIYGRFKRMQGYDVFQPMGLDGFGIHSENYALKIGKHPKEQAKISEANFYRQLSSIGNSFDWSRKLETYDPNYYKWTQWIFIQLFKRGLAYRKKASVNFCPKDLTVLADEQVIDGKCERCDSVVEKKQLEQWFFRITEYADRLLNNIPKLNWTNKVRIAQKEWIGKSEGAQIKFVIANPSLSLRAHSINSVRGNLPNLEDSHVVHSVVGTPQDDSVIEVFTTRPDTLYGATFLVIASEHPIVAALLKSKSQNAKIKEYIEQVKKKTEIERTVENKEKTGIFSGIYAINPINQEKIPVWIADYVLMGYGTGALFGDAHDERDVEFAKKYGIALKPTIITGNKEKDKRILSLEEVYTGYGTLVNSGEFSGLTSKEAMKKVIGWLVENGAGSAKTTYHLRDWLISRQRYWGPPIPMIFCSECAAKGITSIKSTTGSSTRDTRDTLGTRGTPEMAGWFPVPDEQLPVLLPDVADWKPKGEGTSPLANIEEFVNTTCPKCGGKARRETDVSDVFLDSSWYFLRYLATDCNSMPFPSKAFSQPVIASTNDHLSAKQSSKEIAASLTAPRNDISGRQRWLPVTMYIGGAEHSVLHLLYSRFITMVFYDMGLISFEEPYARFYAHGLIIKDGAKMSKSKGNVINPDEYIAKYGADTVRAYLRFVGPFDMGGDFRDSGIEGMNRFIKRVWKLITASSFVIPGSTRDPDDIDSRFRGNDIEREREMHKAIKGVTDDLEGLRYNTAIAKLMTYYNYLSKAKTISNEEGRVFIKLLAPFTPFIAEELWQQMEVSQVSRVPQVPQGEKARDTHDTRDTRGTFSSVHLQPWPTYDPKMLEVDEVTIIVQVNGKLRGQIIVESGKIKDEKYVGDLARESEKVKKYLVGKIKKVIYVQGKIISFVVTQ